MTPGSPRLRASRAALLVAALALAIAVAIAVSEGGVIHLGPVALKVRRPWTASVLGIVCAAVAWALRGSRGVVEDAGRVWTCPGRSPRVVAAGAAVAAAVVGLAWGTWAASGADAYGYVSQAGMWLAGRLSMEVPLAAGAPWPTPEWTFSPFGWRPAQSPAELVPTYAPGLPLAMALAMRAFGPMAAFWIVPLTGALAVWWTWRLGLALGRPWPAAAAAVLMATAPVFLFQVVQPMSDVPVTAWWTGALVFVLSGRPALAGACTALAVLTRPNLAPLALWLTAWLWPASAHHAALAPCAPRRWDGVRRVACFVAAASPGVATWIATNMAWYGHPLSSGYGAFSELFQFGHVGPNAVRYTQWVVQAHGPVLLLAGAGVAATLLAGRRLPSVARGVAGHAQPGTDVPAVSRSTRRAYLAAAGVAVLVVCAYLPYSRFDEWTYLRFLLPALPVMLVMAATGMASGLRVVPPPVAGAVFLLLIAGVAGWQFDVARDGRAFDLRALESRYAAAGAEAKRTWPATTVALAVQHSGSLRHYAGIPTLRWDLLRPENVDRTLDHLRARGLTPIIVLEPWEEPQFRSHLRGGSALGELDWPPAVELDAGAKVRFYQPDDRAVFLSGGEVGTRRVRIKVRP